MRRISLLFLTMILFLASSIAAFAADVPERSGIVTDPIGLFSADEVEQMEAGMSDGKYQVLLLTASGLSEEEGEKLANHAYDSWNLSKDQLMLVVTVNPNYVHLVFENGELANQVRLSNAGDVKGIVDLAFVPSASDGRVADGVIAVSEFVNSLPATSAGETAKPEMPAKPAVPNQSVPSGTVMPNETETSSFVMNVLLAILICLVFVLIVRQLVLFMRMKKQLAETRRVQSEAAAHINKMMVSELFQELEKGFIQGETKNLVSELEQALLQLHKVFQQLQTQLESQKVSLLSTAKTERTIEAIHQEVEKYGQQIEQHQTRLAEIEQQSVEVRKSVERAKERATEISALVEELERDTSFTLSEMKKDMQQALTILIQADRLDEFDYIQAEGLAKQVHQQFDVITNAVKEIKEQVNIYKEFPTRLKARAEELRQVIGREQLLLIDANPYTILQEAELEVSHLGKLIEAGNANGAKTCSAEIEESIQLAGQVVSEMIQHRDFSSSIVHETKQLLAELEEFDAMFDQEQQKLRADYAEVHLQEQSARYGQIMQHKEELERWLVDIKSSLDERVQQYKRAYDLSEMAQNTLTRVKNLREQSLAYYQKLGEIKRSIFNRFETVKSRFYQSASTFEQLRVEDQELKRLIMDIETAIHSLQRLLEHKPVDIYQMEDQLQSVEALVDKCTHLVQRLVKEKEEALRSFRQFQDDFMSRRNRYGRRINQSHYSTNYGKIQSNVEHLIAMGLFAEAMKQIANGHGILAQMEKDYKRSVDQERRRNNSGGFGGGFGGGGFGGGSGWGGSGRSSGSSGWGGGGRSSGSSGWGGGGRSSGSSGWGGSSGGRSSGSSKW